MPLEYSKAKNNSDTCRWNNVFLHSSYNPQIEAQRFCDSLETQFQPENIIVIEPALSYCVDFLKIRFPSSKLFAIRFIKEFSALNLFEKEFFMTSDNSIEDLENELFNYFGETGLLNSLFVTWPPSSKAFENQDIQIWKMLKNLLKTCQNILGTRQFFAGRWIKNQVNFFANIRNTATITKTNLPIIVCGSGPSLKNCIPEIKRNRKNIFLIACSSSISTLLYNNIIPDLCISTDGGFWAKKHLYPLLTVKEKIKLAVSSESNIPQELFSNKNIFFIPVSYEDNYDNVIYKHFDIPFIKGKRNGTVSGTALELALTLTEEPVYLCGIDLEASNGYVHTQPNMLETENSLSDFRLRPREKRIFIQGRDSTQLSVYRNWFISNSILFKDKVFRLSNSHTFNNKLGLIKDMDVKQINFSGNALTNANSESILKSVYLQKNEIKSCFISLLEDKNWINNYFPADCIMIQRASDEELKKLYQKKLDGKLEKIKSYIYRITE